MKPTRNAFLASALSHARLPYVATLVISLCASPFASAASQTWKPAPTDANWATATNWVAGAVPGAVTGTTNDFATFNDVIFGTIGGSTNPIVIDSARRIGNILFDTSTVGAFVIGSNAGNGLTLSAVNSGTNSITVSSTVTNSQVIAAPTFFTQASSQSNPYAFVNNASSSAATLSLTGVMTMSNTTRGYVLSLSGSNTGANTISGNINWTTTTASGFVPLTKTGPGTWILSGTNTFTGSIMNSTASGIQINDGVLSARNSQALGTNATANTAQVAITGTGTLDLASGITLDNGLSLNLANGGTIRSTGSNTTNARVNLAAVSATSATLSAVAGPDVFTIGNGANDLTGGLADTVITVGGLGTVFSTQASTSYLGQWSIASGTLENGSATNGLGVNGIVAFANGSTGKLQLGNSLGLTSLTTNVSSPTAGIVETVVAGTQTLTLTNSGANAYGGILRNGTGILAVTKAGAGTLTLSGANTYSGATSITAGTLSVTNVSGSATGTGAVSIGTAILTGAGSMAGAVTVSGTTIVAPGNNAVGTLTVGGLSLASGSILNYEFNAGPANDKIIASTSGGLTLNGGGFNLYNEGGVTAFSTIGTYNMIGYSGAISGTGVSSLSVLNPQVGKAYTFAATGSNVTLAIASSGVVSNWNVNANGSWNTGGNWTAAIPNGVGQTANFSKLLTAVRTVTLDGSKTLGGLSFNGGASPLGYLIAAGTGGPLVLDNGVAQANVVVTTGANTISADVTLPSTNTVVAADAGASLEISGSVGGSGSLVKSGAGLLNLSNLSNGYAGNTTISGGTLAFQALGSLGGGSLTLNGGTLSYNSGNIEDISSKTIALGAFGGAIDTNGNNVVFLNSIGNSGVGNFAKNGAGSLTLQGNNTFTGTTTVNGGSLILTGTSASTGGTILAGANALLQVSADTGLGVIPGAPANNLTFNPGAGNTATLQAGASFNPDVNRSLLFSSGTGTIDTQANTIALTGASSGSGALSKTGAGNLTIASAQGYTGGTTVNNGTLQINNGGSLAGNIALANGSTFRLQAVGVNSSFVGNAISVAAGATTTFVSSATGNGYSGNLTSGDASSVILVTGGAQAVNFSASNVKQFTNFLGTVNVVAGSNMDSRGTTNNNGGDNTTFQIDGSVSSKNGGNWAFGALTGGSAGNLGGAVTYTVGAKGVDSTYAGNITTSAGTGLVKTGAATLTLTGTANTYTGATSVAAGTLLANGPLGTTAVTVASGATLGGLGSISGATTVASGGILSPGDSAVTSGIGTINHTNLTLAAGSFLNLEFAAGNDKITIPSGGTLNLTTGIKINAYAGTVIGGVDLGTNGTYPIFDVTGATVSGFNSSAFVINNPVSGKFYHFTKTATTISLIVSDDDPINYWNVDGSDSWNTAGNWTKLVVPNVAGAVAKFGPGVGGGGGTFSTNPVVTLDGDKTVGELSFNDDFGSVVTITSGTSGSLLMDNGVIAANISSIAGNHFITAPIAVDAEGLAVDVATTLTLDASGVVSGASAALNKTGLGTLSLSGVNTYGGGTLFSAGSIRINSISSLGTAASKFAGGALVIGTTIAADSRSYQVSGANSAIIDTNGNDYGITAGITPFSGGTGGLTKLSAGTLTLSGVNTFTGATVINAGVIDLQTGGSVGGAALTVNAGSSKLLISGGALTSSAVSTLIGGSVGLQMTGGSATFSAGLNMNTANASANAFANLTGGTFSASFVSMGRCATVDTTVPTQGSITGGFYVNGAAATITGALSVGFSNAGVNSNVSTRIDSGSLTVGGPVLIAVASPNRWSVLDINGGTFASTDATTGVQIGSGQVGNDVFFVRGGTATVERFLLQQPLGSTLTSRLSVSGGALYVGSGGIVGNVNGGAGVLEVQLGGTATLGAKADWSTLLAATLAGTPTIKAADAAGAAHNIAIGGVLTGATGFDKTGGGTLTVSGVNTYTGNVTVTSGALFVTGNSSAATGTVSVASGATLGGNGNLGGSVTIASGGHHALAVGATPGTQATRTISGTLTLTGSTVLDLTAAAAPAGGVYVLATATGGIIGAVPTVNLPGGVTGTVAISGNNLQLTVVAGYSSWATTHAGGQAASLDFDNDGVSNGVEYFMNTAAGFTANPGLVSNVVTWPNGGNIPFADYGTQFVVQISTDLVNWTNVASGGVTNNAGSVSYTVTGAGTRFARLKVTPN